MKTALILTIMMLLQLSPATAKPCHDGTFWSRSFNKCVHRPYDYVAVCRDGTASVFAYLSGACSRHGGVDHVQKKALPPR